MKRIAALLIIASLPAFIMGCAVGDLVDAVPIEPWAESMCDENQMSHYAILMPGFTRTFNIAVAPTTRSMSISELDLEETVSQIMTIGDYVYIVFNVSFGDPFANIFDYRRITAMADRADLGISVALNLTGIPDGVSFANQSIRTAYLTEIENLLFERRPDFLNLCLEMNFFALDDEYRDDYPNLVSLYEEAYDLTKNLSPSTVAYCSHSWELDLFHSTEAPLQLFVDLGHRLDAAGISTFPQMAGVIEPADIPGIYYADLPQYVSVPVIVECGFTDDSGYDSSEEIARDFPAHLIRALDDLNLMQLQLVEMHDLPISGLDPFFHGMGLRRLDGNAKPIFCGWKYIADS